MWAGPIGPSLRAAAKRTLGADRPVYPGREEKKKVSAPRIRAPALGKPD